MMHLYDMKDGMNDTTGSVQSCGMIQILECQAKVMPVSIAKHTVHATTGMLQKVGFLFNAWVVRNVGSLEGGCLRFILYRTFRNS
jgi:hypothetical protein